MLNQKKQKGGASMQNQSLFKFPKARVPRSWFRQFNDKKHFHNDGTLQLNEKQDLDNDYAAYRWSYFSK